MSGPINEQNDTELYCEASLFHHSNFKALCTSNLNGFIEYKPLIRDRRCQGLNLWCNLVNILITCLINEQKWLFRTFWISDWFSNAHFVDQKCIYFQLHNIDKNQTYTNQMNLIEFDKWSKNELKSLIFQVIKRFSTQKNNEN